LGRWLKRARCVKTEHAVATLALLDDGTLGRLVGENQTTAVAARVRRRVRKRLRALMERELDAWEQGERALFFELKSAADACWREFCALDDEENRLLGKRP
jgi:hypothetical protein